jgi:hypothetical protein
MVQVATSSTSLISTSVNTQSIVGAGPVWKVNTERTANANINLTGGRHEPLSMRGGWISQIDPSRQPKAPPRQAPPVGLGRAACRGLKLPRRWASAKNFLRVDNPLYLAHAVAFDRAARATSSVLSMTAWLRSRNLVPTSPAILIVFMVRINTRTPSPSRLESVGSGVSSAGRAGRSENT